MLSILSFGQQFSEENISGTWIYKSVKDRHGTPRKEVSNKDTINLRENNTFYYFLQQEEIFATGVWRIEEDSLVLQYHPFPLPINCEAKLITKDTLVYKKEGKIIARRALPEPETFYLDFNSEQVYLNFIVPNNTGVKMPIRKYAITQLKKKKFVIRENNIFFEFKR